MFQGVSTNGSSDYVIRIGAGSTTTTGYLGTAGILGTTNTQVSYTNGFGIPSGSGSGAASIFHGAMTIMLLGSNNWVSNSVWSNSQTNYTFVGAGSLALGGTLDRVVITTVNGIDAFDAGLVNILYE
jgi:hypothetical protein